MLNENLGKAQQDIAGVLRSVKTLGYRGRVTQAIGTTIRVSGINARIGQQCVIVDKQSKRRVNADVVGLLDGQAILLPFGDIEGIAADSEVLTLADVAKVPAGDALLGRVLDGLGRAMDEIPLDASQLDQSPLYREAPNPLKRQLVDQVFKTGVRTIDGLLTTGVGQRVGIFATAGGGKSTLMGMLARNAQADVIVIGLIGERGREVREFLEHNLGEEGRQRAVVVVATSDRPAMERVRAAYTATAIAEAFRDRGKNVLFLMDSVTRFARALREVGLSVGEPPVRRGFPPSVFAELPRLFERSGSGENAAITAFYTVLVEEDDGSDPVAEEVRSILDGHIILSRLLSQSAHYPAIDVLKSASRVFTAVTTGEHQQAAAHFRSLMAEYEKVEFLLQVGEYKEGSDPKADEAISKRSKMLAFLQQSAEQGSDFAITRDQLVSIANG